MLLLKHGKRLFLALALASALSSCRKDPPPAIDIGTGDGVGGAAAVLKDGTRAYWPPSELNGAWISKQEDMKFFVAWCYGIDPKDKEGMKEITDSMESIKTYIAKGESK